MNEKEISSVLADACRDTTESRVLGWANKKLPMHTARRLLLGCRLSLHELASLLEQHEYAVLEETDEMITVLTMAGKRNCTPVVLVMQDDAEGLRIDAYTKDQSEENNAAEQALNAAGRLAG